MGQKHSSILIYSEFRDPRRHRTREPSIQFDRYPRTKQWGAMALLSSTVLIIGGVRLLIYPVVTRFIRWHRLRHIIQRRI